MEIEEIERRVMTLLLDGDLPVLKGLRDQYSRATITNRNLSGVGLQTDFEVPVDVPPVAPPSFELTDVYYELRAVPNGGSVVLFVRDGMLSLLELSNYAEDWPEVAELTSLSYLTPHQSGRELVPCVHRDLARLQEHITNARSRSASA